MKQILERKFDTIEPLTIEQREDGTSSRRIKGYAVVFGRDSVPFVDNAREKVVERISKDAFSQELLDRSDIKMTMFHDRQILLARSNKGKGSLSYGIDERGVFFSFEAPNTSYGDMALEAVRRGDIAGCSFAFSTYYTDEEYVAVESKRDSGGKKSTTYTVNKILGIHDFTLAADPAYPQTSVAAREQLREMGYQSEEEPQGMTDEQRKQIEALRKFANK